MARTKKIERFSPTEIEPKYGQAFVIEAVQYQDIDRNFTDWIKAVPVEYYDRLISVGKNFSEWKKNKRLISDDFCKMMNEGLCSKIGMIPVKDIANFEVSYLGETGNQIVMGII